MAAPKGTACFCKYRGWWGCYGWTVLCEGERGALVVVIINDLGVEGREREGGALPSPARSSSAGRPASHVLFPPFPSRHNNAPTDPSSDACQNPGTDKRSCRAAPSVMYMRYQGQGLFSSEYKRDCDGY